MSIGVELGTMMTITSDNVGLLQNYLILFNEKICPIFQNYYTKKIYKTSNFSLQ